MALLPLVHYKTEAEYKSHYEREYCRVCITTHDGIRVYFKPSSFSHVFFESTRRNGIKDSFSPMRAERIDWIKTTLAHPSASLFQGWDNKRKRYLPDRRVEVVYEDFIVVLQLSLKKDGTLTANFITCFQADNSIKKIRKSPYWDKQKCVELLEKKRNGR